MKRTAFVGELGDAFRGDAGSIRLQELPEFVGPDTGVFQKLREKLWSYMLGVVKCEHQRSAVGVREKSVARGGGLQ
jgi:hypothetical protein